MTNDDLGAKIETLVDKISQLQVSQNSKADGEMQEDFRISKSHRMRISRGTKDFKQSQQNLGD